MAPKQGESGKGLQRPLLVVEPGAEDKPGAG